MRVWTVHAKGLSPPLLVKEGFSFWAFLLTGPWFLVNRMWLVLVLYLAAWVSGGVLAAEVPAPVILPALVAAQLLIGFHAHDLRRWTLARRGWRLIGVVASDRGEDAAIARLYSMRPELLAWVKAA